MPRPFQVFLHTLLALLSSVLLLLIFPKFDLRFLAPIALTPLLIVLALTKYGWQRFVYGWAAGIFFWFFVCTWIQFVLEVHGGMGRWGGWGGVALFGLYKGLHMAVFAALAGLLITRRWAIPAVAALWTGIERTHGPFGFAWLDLGNAGINMPVPMRLAPITGVYGLSFVFAMLGCAVAGIALQRPRRELAWLLPIPLLLVLPAPPRPAAPTERALVVQPNIDTEMNWTTDTLRETEEKLALLSRAAGAA